jgi:hypothetical protein
MEFERIPVPVISYGANPYLDVIKELANAEVSSEDADASEDAIQFFHDVAEGDTVRKAFDRIKRDLQTAGNMVGVTVRSHIYDAASGRKFILPSEKKAVLKLTGTGKETPEKVTQFRVVFWVTDKIVRDGDDAGEDDE